MSKMVEEKKKMNEAAGKREERQSRQAGKERNESRQKMTRETVPQGFTVKLAVIDAIPVILFGIGCILAGTLLQRALFIIGSVLCFLSGLVKVAWKMIVAVKKRNVWWMFVQMRILMPISFLIMLAGLIGVNRQILWMQLTSMPAVLFFALGIVGIVLMMIFAFTLDSSDAGANWKEQLTNVFAQAAFCAGIICIMIVPDYGAGEEAYNAIHSCSVEESVSLHIEVTDENGMIAFDPGNTDTGVILYPGAKVDYRAYTPLLKACAERGIFAAVVHVPCNIAFLNGDKAKDVIGEYPKIKHWYIAGHSLGGVVGSSFAEKCVKNGDYVDADGTSMIEGVIFLASYPNEDLRGLGIRAISIRGSEDRVLKLEKHDECVENYLDECELVVIDGGCHALFADYGEQLGDGIPTISLEEQIERTADAIEEFAGK